MIMISVFVSVGGCACVSEGMDSWKIWRLFWLTFLKVSSPALFLEWQGMIVTHVFPLRDKFIIYGHFIHVSCNPR